MAISFGRRGAEASCSEERRGRSVGARSCRTSRMQDHSIHLSFIFYLSRFRIYNNGWKKSIKVLRSVLYQMSQMSGNNTGLQLDSPGEWIACQRNKQCTVRQSPCRIRLAMHGLVYWACLGPPKNDWPNLNVDKSSWNRVIVGFAPAYNSVRTFSTLPCPTSTMDVANAKTNLAQFQH